MYVYAHNVEIQHVNGTQGLLKIMAGFCDKEEVRSGFEKGKSLLVADPEHLNKIKPAFKKPILMIRVFCILVLFW
jgi:hypothetical protein